MKKRNILLLTLICTCTTIWAQKYNKNIDYTTDVVKVSAFRYPLSPLGDQYKTYAIEMGDKAYDDGYIVLPYQLIDDKDKADLVLQVSITDFQIQPNGMDTIAQSHKYLPKAKIKGNVHISIYDNHRQEYLEKLDNPQMEVEWKEIIEMSAESALQTLNNPDKLASRVGKEGYGLLIFPMNTIIRNKYETVSVSRAPLFLYINQPNFYQSHFDYYNFTNLKRALNNVDEDVPLAERYPAAEEYIQQQLALVQLYTKNDSTEAKIRAIALYNAAAAAFLVDRFDEAKKYITMAEANDGQLYCGNALKKLKADIEDTQQRLKINNKTNSFGQ